jgi:peptide/nickel transport system ATP-binding protein
MRLVGIGAAEKRLKAFPHELSGGMRQRVMIAMALAGEPKLLILDEPTTALDVTTQAQILEIVRDLRARTGMAILLITHDLGVVADLADRVVVMYAGAKVEEADVYELFQAPRHPYAAGLLGALPGSALARQEAGQLRLAEIPGMVPVLRMPLESCAFAPRCHSATDQCRTQPPLLEECGPGDAHEVACFHPEPVAVPA